MAKAEAALTLLPFHTRVLGEMSILHPGIHGATERALRAMQEISTTSIPARHIDDVRDGLNSMLQRLGGPDSRRFDRPHRKTILRRAAQALEQQEQAGDAAAARTPVTTDAADSGTERSIPRHAPEQAAAA